MVTAVKVRELRDKITDHAADGRRLNDVVLVKVGRDLRRVTASYTDGTFILIAGRLIKPRS